MNFGHLYQASEPIFQLFNKQMLEELADAKTALVCHTSAAVQRERELAGALEREQGHLQQAVAYYEQVRRRSAFREPAPWPTAQKPTPEAACTCRAVP